MLIYQRFWKKPIKSTVPIWVKKLTQIGTGLSNMGKNFDPNWNYVLFNISIIILIHIPVGGARWVSPTTDFVYFFFFNFELKLDTKFKMIYSFVKEVEDGKGKK